MTEANVLIRTLTPDLLPDWLALFDNKAFVDNPAWSSCYCQFYHADHDQRDWSERTGPENRSASIQLIQRGRLRGYLAYVKSEAVGWCQASPRTLVPYLDSNLELQVEDADRVGAILCFLVAPPYRTMKVGQSLLAAACRGLAGQGAQIAEGYPRRSAKSDASNYHGPLSMYRSAGLKPYREFEDFLVVRKELWS